MTLGEPGRLLTRQGSRGPRTRCIGLHAERERLPVTALLSMGRGAGDRGLALVRGLGKSGRLSRDSPRLAGRLQRAWTRSPLLTSVFAFVPCRVMEANDAFDVFAGKDARVLPLDLRLDGRRHRLAGPARQCVVADAGALGRSCWSGCPGMRHTGSDSRGRAVGRGCSTDTPRPR